MFEQVAYSGPIVMKGKCEPAGGRVSWRRRLWRCAQAGLAPPWGAPRPARRGGRGSPGGRKGSRAASGAATLRASARGQRVPAQGGEPRPGRATSHAHTRPRPLARQQGLPPPPGAANLADTPPHGPPHPAHRRRAASPSARFLFPTPPPTPLQSHLSHSCPWQPPTCRSSSRPGGVSS